MLTGSSVDKTSLLAMMSRQSFVLRGEVRNRPSLNRPGRGEGPRQPGDMRASAGITEALPAKGRSHPLTSFPGQRRHIPRALTPS